MNSIDEIIVDYHLEAEKAVAGKIEHYPSIVEARNQILSILASDEGLLTPVVFAGILNKYFPYIGKKDRGNEAIRELCELFEIQHLKSTARKAIEDRPDREKIAKAIFDWDYEGINTWGQNCIGKEAYYTLADTIIALFPGEEQVRKDEAEAIIRCVKDAKRVHPDWGINDVVDLLSFREETRQALQGEK